LSRITSFFTLQLSVLSLSTRPPSGIMPSPKHKHSNLSQSSGKQKTDSTVCPSEWPPSGASTPYKRWSKCAMKKNRGEGFCTNLGGKCVNNSCASLLSIFTTVLTHCYLLHLHLFSRCCHWSDNRPTLH